ncbi:MAG: M28 family peptidase, partial [Candidatus Hydrogenedentes bacterium]|nr:M28 family peptidase [Candidatus Hydrogenedentota bacterium]
MSKVRYIVFWCLVVVVGLFIQFVVTKWATETEKDPDLAETVLFTPDQYPSVASRFTADGLKAHIDALSSIPSRLTGTAGCDEATEYIRTQFRALKVGEPVVQEFPATVPVHDRAEVQTPQGAFKLHPLYPNGVCPAAVPKDGLKTRLIYAGSGSLAEVQGKILDGATVVVETGAREQWLYLIDLGARAIIFIERERPPRYIGMTTQTMSHQDIPRFWMTKAEGAPLSARLKSGDLDATLYSDARWEHRTGKNIYIDIPGASTKEINKEEMVVFEAYYDSSSFVPDLAPGAEQACGIAALLEMGKLIAEHRFQKRVRLLATSGHFQALEGARQYAWENVGKHTSPMRDVSPQGHAAFFGFDLSSGGSRIGLFYAGNYFWQFEGNVKPRVSDLGRRATQYTTEIAKAFNQSPEELFVDTINPAFGKEWFTYAPTGLALDHEPALLAGVPSLSFVTVNDSRFFTATPDDTDVNLENLAKQVRLLGCLLPNAFNVEGRYLKRSMQRIACQVTGRVVSFDPKEGYLPNKPVPNAVVTLRGKFDQMSLTGVMANPLGLANDKGEFTFSCLGYNAEALYQLGWLAFEAYVVKDGHITWAPDFGQMGRESYPSKLLPVQKEMQLMLVAFPCKTLDLYNLADPRNCNLLNSLDVLEAASNSPPSVYGTTLMESDWPSFMAPTASIFTQPGKRLKITAGAGAAQKRMLLLNVPEHIDPGEIFNTGNGFAIDETPAIHHTYMQSATDMFRLDESRIGFFGSHGIKNARVNTLHRLAGDALEKARQALDLRDYQEYFVQAKRALGFESRAYPDVVGMANDVVRGLVFYLVLLIPFAFATERLFLAGRRIETRILGIVAMFLAMFIALRFTHPAFRIVLSPMVVLLGFAVATLSVVIISIVMAKLEALVSKRKIEQQGEHESGVQAVSGIALALELGIANMRRRRARTVLTSITLIVLTFSVLSFMSVTAQLRIQQYTYSEGATPYKGVLLRTRNWMPFPFETYASLRNEYGKECTLAARRWYYGALTLNRSFIDIDKGDVIRSVSSLAGLTAEEQKFFN